MIKKFLFTLLTMLVLSTASFSSSHAGTLNFSHASVIMECLDQDSARHLSEVVQRRQPGLTDLGTCNNVPNFGSSIHKDFIGGLGIDSPIMEDWEGDPFAIFTYTFLNGETFWLIIYNPSDILSRNQVRKDNT